MNRAWAQDFCPRVLKRERCTGRSIPIVYGRGMLLGGLEDRPYVSEPNCRLRWAQGSEKVRGRAGRRGGCKRVRMWVIALGSREGKRTRGAGRRCVGQEDGKRPADRSARSLRVHVLTPGTLRNHPSPPRQSPWFKERVRGLYASRPRLRGRHLNLQGPFSAYALTCATAASPLGLLSL